MKTHKLLIIATDYFLSFGECMTAPPLRQFAANGWQLALVGMTAEQANSMLPDDDIFTEKCAFADIESLRQSLGKPWPVWTRFIACQPHWLAQLTPAEIEEKLRCGLIGEVGMANGAYDRCGNNLWRRDTLLEMLQAMAEADQEAA